MTAPLTSADFPAFFRELWGHDPFPWQAALARQVVEGEGWPETLALPTGAGKTAALDIAVFHLAVEALRGSGRAAPCRIALVVDRRLVVDGAYRRARTIANRLAAAHDGALRRVADGLRSLAAPESSVLAVARLRGGLPGAPDWVVSPGQPTIVTSTVDQVGSRLLFRGYGVSAGMRPVHAGLLGRDSLFLVDEAHLSRPFAETVREIAARHAGPDDRPPRMVAMTATPPDTENATALRDADRDDPVLSKRLAARKPARLVASSGGVDTAGDALVRDFADWAWALSALPGPTRRGLDSPCPNADPAQRVAVVVNRVDLARRIHEALDARIKGQDADAAATLRIGRIRPVDRAALAAEDAVFLAGTDRGEPERVHFLVATQGVEVGADFDFDALVTQAAPLDSLRQRFGRLDRLGARGTSPAAVVAAKADQRRPDKADDPVYGSAAAATWAWLQGQAVDGIVDFGIDHLPLPASAAEREPLLAPTSPAPLLFPAYVEKWSRTQPAPGADPDPAAFLHGPQAGAGDVTLVWRDDVTPGMLGDEPQRAVDLLDLVPPSAPEGMALPIGQVRRWLAGRATAPVDVEGADGEDAVPGGDADAPRVLRRAADGFERVRVREIRPGDVVVVPAAWGGCDAFGFAPASTDPVVDHAETAAVAQRRRLVLRLTRERLAAELPAETAAGDVDRIWRDISALLAEHAEHHAGLLAELKHVPGLPARWQDCLARTEAGKHVPDLPAHWRVCLATSEAGRPRVLTPYGAPDAGAVLVWPGRVSAETALQLAGLDAEAEDTVTALPATEDDGAGDGGVWLATHLDAVATEARTLATAAGLSDGVIADIALAARLHDLGKAEPRFQAMLHGGDELAAAVAKEPLAKASGLPTARQRARARTAAGLPRGARHECWSVRLAETHPALAEAHDPVLVRWLIGTHHGFGRPFFPPVEDAAEGKITVPAGLAGTTEPVTAAVRHRLERIDSGWCELFARLKARYGVWGLAYLEAVLRLADHRVSDPAITTPDGEAS